jgi:large subunit ribosomal protein L4|tara:strand:- start:545 stop:1174 length:630 start_codon:yes stop_codon:yes gene_type:complete
MELKVQALSGEEAGTYSVGFNVIEDEKGEQAVHDTVVAYMAAQRSGTAKTKDRGEVSGTGKKPWRQKGTGRARTGSLRTNIFSGGGVVHGPVPRDFSKKVNSKTRTLALRKALSERLKDGEVTVVADLNLETKKTKALCAQLDAIDTEAKTLLIVDADASKNDNLCLASRNIPLVELAEASSLNTYQVLRSDRIIITQAGLDTVAGRLK